MERCDEASGGSEAVPCSLLVLDMMLLGHADRVIGGLHTFQLTHHDYMLSGDSAANAKQRRFVNECLYEPKNILEEVRQHYESITTDLLHKHSRKLGKSYHVDIVRE